MRPVLGGNRAAEGAPYLSVGLGAQPELFVGPKFESESPKAGKSGASVDAEERGDGREGQVRSAEVSVPALPTQLGA